MSEIIHISEAASIGLHAMMLLAAEDHRLLSTKEMARKLSVSEAHLSKVMQRLAKVDLVRSTKGPSGGFILDRPKEKITLIEVYEAIEGPLVHRDCLLHKPLCGGGKNCIFGGLFNRLNRDVVEYLAGTRLSDVLKKED
ncbi:MAG: Rrf2 family transcriptional regulator [Vulcanimicrobiota bacterium]